MDVIHIPAVAHHTTRLVLPDGRRISLQYQNRAGDRETGQGAVLDVHMDTPRLVANWVGEDMLPAPQDSPLQPNVRLADRLRIAL